MVTDFNKAFLNYAENFINISNFINRINIEKIYYHYQYWQATQYSFDVFESFSFCRHRKCWVHCFNTLYGKSFVLFKADLHNINKEKQTRRKFIFSPGLRPRHN